MSHVRTYGYLGKKDRVREKIQREREWVRGLTKSGYRIGLSMFYTHFTTRRLVI